MPPRKSLEVFYLRFYLRNIHFRDRTIFKWYLVHMLKVLILCKVTKLYPRWYT